MRRTPSAMGTFRGTSPGSLQKGRGLAMTARSWWVPVVIIAVLAFLFEWPWWVASVLAVLAIGSLQLLDARRRREPEEHDASGHLRRRP